MGVWNYASKPEQDGSIELKLSLNEIDSNGALSGTALFRSVSYNVTGQWAAAGSVPGRNASVFWFGGANGDISAFLVAAGDIKYSGDPRYMDITVITASAGDGDDYGFNDRIFCTDPPPEDPDDFGG